MVGIIFIYLNFAKNIFLMKKFINIISLFSFLGFYTIEAQEVVKKDTINGTEVSITMNERINKTMEDMEGKCNRTKDSSFIGATKSSTKIDIPSKPKTNAEICRDNPRILGYKIQVAVVKSNEEANKVKAYFRTKFPYLKAETNAALRPNYKILVGSYFSKQSAASDLARIRTYFKEALPVQHMVFCVEAK